MMKNIDYERYFNGLKNNNVDELNEFTAEFTNNLLTNYIKGEFDKVKSTIDSYSETRERFDDELDIERNTSYYYGFLYANEYILSNILNETEQIEKSFIKFDSKKHVRNMFLYIDKKGFVTHKDLSEYLDISKSQLSNIVKELGNSNEKLMYKEKLGKNIFYSLCIRGKAYCEMLKKRSENLSIEEIIRKVSEAFICGQKPLEKDSVFVYNAIEKIMEEMKMKKQTENKYIDFTQHLRSYPTKHFANKIIEYKEETLYYDTRQIV
ncbi:hypothetical protein KPL47_22805 [Clostridium estertheticum]|uniref:hypothetical protein n=1 Tax=Clostridium TaxID=1485 RepID=UPI001C0D8B03|nr:MULTISPECIES: hypothetical protein [Clostridium]MBU3146525.1 hypothetical protein [Clostridium sp. CF012]MBU3179128.1 hypothetical protein [Clostridium estertheticum]